MFRDWRWGITETLWQKHPLLLELLCGQGGARPLQKHLHAGWGLDLCLRWPHIRVSFIPANGELTRLLQGMSLSAPTVPRDCQLWPPWWPGSRWSVTSPPWHRASSSVTWTTASGTLRWHYTCNSCTHSLAGPGVSGWVGLADAQDPGDARPVAGDGGLDRPLLWRQHALHSLKFVI